ncbi:hypothetical protein [Providencia sp.]|uniref:hypothetical protein n=1 Tax=Providencia sp. TaxID=589 RepID=UPI000E9F58EA|nr:hypothetical protein [Providencia sp.]MBP6080155.1 hypothetical protein [Providencia sp.]HBO23140.1 hypothetical protein [Providencia sp.]
MKNVKLSLIAMALAGLSTHALAVAPAPGSTAKAQIDLEVVPTKVTCEMNISNGTTAGNFFRWTPGLAVGAAGSVITDNSTSLKRSMNIDFTNPTVPGGPEAVVACDTAGNGLDLLFTAHATDTAALTTPYQGKIERIDGTRWFNYAVAVNKTAFTAAVEAASGAGKATVAYPTSAGLIGDSDAIDLQGTAGDIKISKAAGNVDPDFKLGQYPIEIYLQSSYTNASFPEVAATAADNIYRGNFTIQATYQ